MNIGIVGAGGIGTRHAQAYAKHPKSDVVAVCDIDEARASQLAEAHGARTFSSIADMLAGGIDLVACSVCTKGEENGGDHFAPTIELLEAGIPVLGEKPISNRVDEGRKMVELAAAKNLPYAINLNHRFTPAAERAREWMDSGRLGTLHMIGMTMWINNPVETSPWFHIRALHPHSIDVMRYFGGDIRRVAAFFMKGEGRAIWSNAKIIFEFAGGTIGSLTGSYDAGGGFGLETCDVTGSKGRFLLEEACQRLTFFTRESQEAETLHYLGGMLGFNETFDSRIARWVDQLDEGVPPEQIDASGVDALQAQLVIEACVRSFERSEVVEVESLG